MTSIPIDVNAIFERALAERQAAFERMNDDEYVVQVGSWRVTANLANVRRNAERDGDPEAVRRFAAHILDFRAADVPWREASALLRFSAEPTDSDFGDAIVTEITGELCRVLTLTDEAESKVTWVTPRMCADWGVPVDDALAVAARNQDRLLEGVELQVEDIDGECLGMVPVDSPYKASVIFAGSFRRLVERQLGWPVLVVIPCRDFIYMVRDGSPLVPRLGGVVVREFQTSGHPITTEVFQVSDEGVAAIGRFPV